MGRVRRWTEPVRLRWDRAMMDGWIDEDRTAGAGNEYDWSKGGLENNALRHGKGFRAGGRELKTNIHKNWALRYSRNI